MAALITKSSANLATETSQKKLSYRLHVVPFQLRFDFSPTSHIFCIGSCKLGSRFLDADGDEERNARSAAEWIDAVLSYLEFRAGSKWRRGKARHRQSVRY